jgi:hypothetical protein
VDLAAVDREGLRVGDEDRRGGARGAVRTEGSRARNASEAVGEGMLYGILALARIWEKAGAETA